jgi:zinc protease
MLKRYFIPLILALVALAFAIYIASGHSSAPRDVRAAIPVERFTLSNGLTVVVMPSDRIPVVTHLLVVKAGGADDPYGKTGLAHFLEHLIFSGTKNFPEGAYDRAIGRVGGAHNAYTTRDYTLYYATVPKKHLATVMAMEADRFANIAFDDAQAAREVKIITEERSMRVDNSPMAQLSEQLMAMTFLNHPYGRPIIGWPDDIAGYTAADARSFFEAYYRPSNMILVVAGDVTAREVRRYAQRYYGALPAGEQAPRLWPTEPPMRMTRRGEMRDAKVTEPRLIRQYVAPSVKHGDAAQTMPLAIFAQYIGGGDTSLLYRRLVREQRLASDISAGYDQVSIGPGTLRITAVPAEGVDLKTLEDALDRALTEATTQLPDATEITNAKTIFSAQLIYTQDGLEGVANLMAEFYAIGLDEQYFYGLGDAIGAVDAASVQAAARAVIVPARAVTGYLLPETSKPAEVTDAR